MVLNYETLDAFKKDYQSLSAPCVARIVNGDKVIIATKAIGDSKFTYTCGGKTTQMNGEVSERGSIVVWNGTDKILVRPEDFKGTEGTPIGVVVIPSEHASDGKAKMVSLKWMDYSNPETGSTDPVNMYWGCSSVDTSLTNYTQIPNIDRDNPESGTISLNSSGYFPAFEDGYYQDNESYETDDDGNEYLQYFTMKCVKNGSIYVSSDVTRDSADSDFVWDGDPDFGWPAGPNALNSDGTLNSNFAYEGTALADMDGASNTKIIYDNYATAGKTGTIANSYSTGNYPAFVTTQRYKTDGTSARDWYVPSAFEGVYLLCCLQEINTSLKAINASTMGTIGNGRYFWTSTEYSSCNAWIL